MTRRHRSLAFLLAGALGAGPSFLPGVSTCRAQEPPGLQRREYSGLWPFYSRERFEDGRVRYASLFETTVFEWGPGENAHYRVLPFFGYSRRNEGRDRELALYPLLYHRRRSPARDHDILFPFFGSWREEEQREWFLWPLAHTLSGPDPSSGLEWAPILWRYKRDETGGERLWQLGATNAIDLASGYVEPDEDDWWGFRLLTVLPPLWHDPTYASLGAALSRKDGWHAHLFPLFAAGTGLREDRLRAYAWTLLLSWNQLGEDAIDIVIPPLLARWQDRSDGLRRDLLWPLLHYSEDAERRRLRLLPFYSAFDQESEEHGSHHRRFYSIFYGHTERSAEGTTTTADWLPILLARRLRAEGDEPRQATDILFPLVHWSERGAPGDSSPRARALRLLPFFDRASDADGHSLGVGLVLYRESEDTAAKSRSQWLLFPLGHLYESPEVSTSWLLPFWLSRERRTEEVRERTRLLFPLYFRRQEEHPRPDRADEWVTTRDVLQLWPFYGWDRIRTLDGKSESLIRYVAYPFFSWRESTGGQPRDRGPTRHVDAPWPLVQYHRDSQERFFFAWPIVFTGSDDDETWVRLWPLLSVHAGPRIHPGFWSYLTLLQVRSRPTGGSFHVVPWLWRQDWSPDASSWTALMGLGHYSRHGEEGWFHLLPLGGGSWDAEGHRFGIFPLFWHRDDGSRAPDRSGLLRWLFLYNGLEGGGETHHRFLWKLFEYHSASNGDHDVRVLHRLFVDREVSGQKELVVNPFFSWSEDDTTGDRSFSLLGFVYRRDESKGRVTHRLFWIPVATSGPAGR